MFIVLIIFFVAGIAMMFIQNRTTQIIYAAIGVVIFTIVIIYCRLQYHNSIESEFFFLILTVSSNRYTSNYGWT